MLLLVSAAVLEGFSCHSLLGWVHGAWLIRGVIARIVCVSAWCVLKMKMQ
jgi:hypothetical protein